MNSFRKRTTAPRGDHNNGERESLLPLTAESRDAKNGSSTFSYYDKPRKHKTRIRQRQPYGGACCCSWRCCCRGLVVLVLVILSSLGLASLYVPRRQLLDAKLYLDVFLFWLEDHGLWGTPVRGFQTKEFYLKEYPELKMLEDNFETIQAEWNAAKGLLNEIPAAAKVVGFKKKAFQYEHTHWRSLVLKLGNVIEENRHLAPKTLEWLEDIPYVYTASFSIFESHTYLPPHWGYWKGYVRYQLAVQVPKVEDGHCWIRMQPGAYKTPARSDLINHGNFSLMEEPGAVRYTWTEGDGVLFDDTSAHDANNDSDQVRAVLYLDLGRKLPWVLHSANQLLLWFINHSPQIRRMQQMAPVNKDVAPQDKG